MNAITRPVNLQDQEVTANLQSHEHQLSQVIKKQQKLNFHIRLSQFTNQFLPIKIIIKRTKAVHQAVLSQLAELENLRNLLLTAQANDRASNTVFQLTQNLSRLLSLNEDTILLLQLQARSTLLFKTFEGIRMVAQQITESILMIHLALTRQGKLVFERPLCMN